MFDAFIKNKKRVRILQKGSQTYLNGYIIGFDPFEKLVTIHGDETYVIPLSSIIHLYESK